MNLYWIKTNRIIKRLFSNQVWDLPNTEEKIYLTFDDGPTPEITEWILAVLRKHEIKATFFCLGNNIQKYPELFQKLVSEGHAIGNHTFNHVLGWRTSTKKYLENTRSCEEEIAKQITAFRRQRAESQVQSSEAQTENRKLFRPPYGKIRASQSAKLRKLGYKIIMWDILSADFDTNVSPEKCLENVTKNTTQGSIIVFHDSVKAFPNLEYVLPKTIEILKEKGFRFDTIR